MMEKDYIAIIFIGGGSSFGRAPDKNKAMDICINEAKQFGKALGGFKDDAQVSLNLYDATGNDQVTWDGFGVRGDETGQLERLEVRTIAIGKI